MPKALLLSLVGLVALMLVLLVLAISSGRENNALAAACANAGGVAVVDYHRATLLCVSRDALIDLAS